jgi:hypothetical protein
MSDLGIAFPQGDKDELEENLGDDLEENLEREVVDSHDVEEGGPRGGDKGGDVQEDRAGAEATTETSKGG